MMNKERATSGFVREAKRRQQENVRGVGVSKWNVVYTFGVAVVVFLMLLWKLVVLQVVQGESLYARSQTNKLSVRTVYPLRGIIYDRDGVKLAENIPAYNIYIALDEYRDDDDVLDVALLIKTVKYLTELLVDSEVTLEVDEEVLQEVDEYKSEGELLLISGVDNKVAIVVRSNLGKLRGVYLDNATKRFYSYPESFAHVIGYVSKAGERELAEYDYISWNDTVGKSGIERQYDEVLIGVKGKTAVEIDALGRVVSDTQLTIEPSQIGKSVHLSIDSEMQMELYDLLAKGVTSVGARAGAAVVEDIHTGELLALVSYPAYDNNQFIGGISSTEYQKLTDDSSKPLFNRAISAQQPPGSIFKTLVLSAALDAEAINKNTTYVSSADYTLSNGASFYEYRRVGHGRLNVVQALAVSSNIYPCETIRNWEIDELVDYLDAFGVGKETNVDLPGEQSGRLPSPENKIALAESSAPWLDAVWYPEGDACNSVIGQGITLVTPIQAVNFAATIANGGDVLRPHIGLKYSWVMDIRDKFNQGYEDTDGGSDVVCYDLDSTDVDELKMESFAVEDRENFVRVCEQALEVEKVVTDIISNDNLAVIRRGMREAVAGNHGIIRVLNGTSIPVAAKTGTAEYGKRNAKGEYVHSHAWIIGFYPYDDPQYSFVIFMEDGGKSSNVAGLARDFIDWVSSRE